MKKFGRIKVWIILPIGVFLLGCASIRDVRTLDSEIDKLHSEVSALRKENKSLENKLDSELSALRKENSSLENKISALSDENQKLKTEFLFRLENLQSEIRILSTGIEEYKDYLKGPSKEIGRVKEDVEVRLRILEERRRNLEEKNKAQEEKNKAQEEKIREMEDRLKGVEGKMKQAELEKSSSAKEVLSEPKGFSAGMGDLYKDAYEAFQRGDLEGARRKFETFLKQYPNADLSGNAQFWIGETYYQKKDFEKAILEYEKAITKYPESGKISAAIFKQALAFLELGDKTNARNLFRKVIERYPNSEQAEMAKKKLETIK